MFENVYVKMNSKKHVEKQKLQKSSSNKRNSIILFAQLKDFLQYNDDAISVIVCKIHLHTSK